MTAYDPSQWSDLFVATAGASAALAGLLFVAVSINVDRILKYKGLPERGLETVLLLLGVLLASIFCLVPGQGQVPLGLELLVLGLVLGAITVRLPAVSEGGGQSESMILARWGLRALALVPLILAGLTLLVEAGGGLYWVVAGIVFAVIAAVANAWVLLVEILR